MTPPSPHRSFVRTTVLAVGAAAAATASLGFAVYCFDWNARHPVVPSPWSWLLLATAVVALALVLAFTSLVALGGAVVVYRNACEEQGVPYIPSQPREQVTGPLLAALLRKLHPGLKLRPGELVEVRSLPEIMATLDDKGCLDGLPFMPEMVAFCGHRLPVHRRVDKVWEYAHGSGLRSFKDAVLLKTSRCNGRGHDGCQASCQLVWKEAWLKLPGTPASSTVRANSADLHAHTRVTVDGTVRYVCQMTEIPRAAGAQLGAWDLRHYWRDWVRGNVRLSPIVVALGVRVFNAVQWRLRGPSWPVLGHLDSDTTPHVELGIQPGSLVRIKSKREIEATLNRKLRNRGMEFGYDMLFCCGGSYRVAARIDTIVHEGSGELLHLKTPSLLLEGAHANGGAVITPQNEYFFWREIWVDPVTVPTASPAADAPVSASTVAR